MRAQQAVSQDQNQPIKDEQVDFFDPVTIPEESPIVRLDVILGLKPLDMVIEEVGLSGFMKLNPQLKRTVSSITRQEGGAYVL